MKSGAYFRIVMMIGALVAVLWLIRSLNSGAMDKAFEALGLQADTGSQQAPGRPAQPAEVRLNLCPNPIVAFIWNSQIPAARRVIEKREAPGTQVTKWWVVDLSPREIHFDVEKWLSDHCQVGVRTVDENVVATISSRLPLDLRYADGSTVRIDEISRQYFKFRDRYYESAELAVALKELRVAAKFEPAPINMPAKVAPANPSEAENQGQAH